MTPKANTLLNNYRNYYTEPIAQEKKASCCCSFCKWFWVLLVVLLVSVFLLNYFNVLDVSAIIDWFQGLFD
ncbi:hypothetical protein KIPB_006793 [Kipferlia bialata]|uniref:Uncharacterized protein n=1 Tax=Kipferlia bialata TaxID=797122 RepID=A0A9K3CZ23_9EUKA|nr:hypothetical protein KIPB_006793 [Kipferlia bialata]|eukprot:g6793.t1